MATELKVTSAEDYADVVEAAHASEGELVRLPTKAVFKLMRANMAGMVLVGEMPQSLTNETLRVLSERGKPVEASPEGEALPEDSPERLIFMRETVRKHCIEPRLGYEAGKLMVLNKAGIAIRTLDGDDFLFAFEWITGGDTEDGLMKSGNRHERRVAAHKSRRRKVRSEPVLAGK